ncbi:hypothetical protein MKX01_039851 [Papaver californicum]|nr:hypothetical protein MKX01_039851 [Papaver californicum]
MAAKFCQLMKFKSVLKKWRSMGKHNRSISSSYVADIHPSTSDDHINRSSTPPAAAVIGGGGGGGHHEDLQAWVRSSSVSCESELSTAAAGGKTFDCEVVMFEHLLWMIENSDPLEDHESSIDGDDEHELVDYYVCS